MRRYGRVTGFSSDEAQRSYLEAYDAALALSPVPLEPRDLATPPFGTTRVYAAGPEDAPALVALHGKLLSSTMWLDLLPTLTAGHRVYLVDAIGELGRSASTRMLHNPTDVVAWLDAVLDGLDVGRAALVGHSNGAFQSATFATERPERVDRVALLAPAAVFTRISREWWTASLPAMVGTNRGKIERFWHRLSVTTDPTPTQTAVDDQMVCAMVGMRSAFRDAWPRTYRADRLGRMAMPVLVVFGRQDLIGDADRSAARVREVLPHARVEVLDDCSHMVGFDQPETTAKLLADFLTP